MCTCMLVWVVYTSMYKDTCVLFIHLNKYNKGCGLAICIKKYLKAKEELWKLKYFTIAKI